MTTAHHLEPHAQEEAESKRGTPSSAALEAMPTSAPSTARQQAVLNMQRTQGNAAVQRLLNNPTANPIQRQPVPQPQPPAGQPSPTGGTPTASEVAAAILKADFSLPGDLQVNLHLADAELGLPGLKPR